MVGDARCTGSDPCSARPVSVVQQGEDQIVSILVFVAVLKGKDLQDRIRQNVGYAYSDTRATSAIETFALDATLNEIIADQVSAPNVESAELRSGALAFRPIDAARIHLIGLAKELQDDPHAIYRAGPAKAGFQLLELCVLQVVLKRSVCLGSFVTECQSND